MVHDPNDQHQITIQSIKYAMLSVCQLAYALAQIRFCCSNRWMAAKHFEHVVKAAHIGIGNLFTELLEAIGIYSVEIRLCRTAKPQLYAFLPYVGR